MTIVSWDTPRPLIGFGALRSLDDSAIFCTIFRVRDIHECDCSVIDLDLLIHDLKDAFCACESGEYNAQLVCGLVDGLGNLVGVLKESDQ